MKTDNIQILLAETKKEIPDPEGLIFGRAFTDHMFVMDYADEVGWHDPRIVPYAPLQLDPAAIVFHYGQTVFEGLKAYLTKSGDVQLFRPDKNIQRLNKSCERLCMPQVDEEFLLTALKQLIATEKAWVPGAEGTSLYIRPFVIATEPYLGVSPSHKYKLLIILSPVGAYYKEGINPVKILVENEYVRAVAGGTGEAKTAGNYAAGLKAQEVAEEMGYSQVLWLDGVQRKYIEEVGSMNIFFKIDGEVVTPALNGSILPGITRDSIIELLKYWDVPVSERKISVEELYAAHQEGKLEEVFGTGTAAVISPVGELSWQNEKIVVNQGKTGPLAKKLYDTLTGIQYGTIEDPFEWVIKVDSTNGK